ncbi:MAG: fused MFS/spermidine synthase [Alphaproteobacteria bacterium]|nr:fused MFS/spermidine synthase [Alphaproteobacteria bacterium]
MGRLARIAGDFGEITILRSRKGGSRIYMQGEGLQSHADSAGVSLSYYIHALYGLVLQTRARDVLMIGCGGGTLGTMLSRVGRNVTIVDIDPVSFALAREYFALSPAIRCAIGDGAAFLRRCRCACDVLVVDAFIGDKVPPHLRSEEFFRIARKRLRPRGHILVNVLLANDRDRTADAIAAAMAKAGLAVQLLDTTGDVDRNAIVVGGRGAALERPSLLVAPRRDRKSIADALDEMRFRPWRRRHQPTPR